MFAGCERGGTFELRDMLSPCRTLATSPDDSLRDGAEALKFAQRAVKLSSSKDAAGLNARGAAYAECGQFAAAEQDAQAALQLAQGDKKLADDIRERLECYRQGKPFRFKPTVANVKTEPQQEVKPSPGSQSKSSNLKSQIAAPQPEPASNAVHP